MKVGRTRAPKLSTSPTRGLLARGPSLRAPKGARFNAMGRTFRRNIEDAIRHAWQRVRASPSWAALAAAGEVQLSVRLQEELNAMLDAHPAPVPGWDGDVFQDVVRGAEICDFSGQKLEKRPDLTFRLCGRVRELGNRSYRGLFVECKVVDATHSVHRYCAEGLERFLCGDYAWAMPEGMMLGYVRGAHTVPGTLTPHLAERKAQYLVRRAPRRRRGEAHVAWPVFVSLHGRRFKLPSVAQPVPIEVGHLWLEL